MLFVPCIVIKLCNVNQQNALKTYHTKLHVQMVFLMKNTWCSKHVEDTKNWIKTLVKKCAFCWL